MSPDSKLSKCLSACRTLTAECLLFWNLGPGRATPVGLGEQGRGGHFVWLLGIYWELGLREEAEDSGLAVSKRQDTDWAHARGSWWGEGCTDGLCSPWDGQFQPSQKALIT